VPAYWKVIFRTQSVNEVSTNTKEAHGQLEFESHHQDIHVALERQAAQMRQMELEQRCSQW